MSEGIINLAVFGELQEAAGSDFVAELVGTFLEETPGILSDLKLAASSNNQEQFRRSAHSVKSNAETFGATRLAELAREIELGGLQSEEDANDKQITQLNAAFESAASELKDLLDG